LLPYQRKLLESELFGHEKGHSLGLRRRNSAKFELADKGPYSSTRLVRWPSPFSEDHEDHSGGRNDVWGIKTIPWYVGHRCHNKDIERAVSEGHSGKPLLTDSMSFLKGSRKRKAEDIPLLVDFFTKKYCAEMKTRERGL